MDSILITIKKMLGIEPDYEHFDTDIIIYINGVIMGLTQLGVGPDDGFFITGSEELWTSFISERKDLEAAKTYIYLKVRLIFDPPSSSFVIDAIERQVKEIEWRLGVNAEEVIINVEGGL